MDNDIVHTFLPGSSFSGRNLSQLMSNISLKLDKFWTGKRDVDGISHLDRDSNRICSLVEFISPLNHFSTRNFSTNDD